MREKKEGEKKEEKGEGIKTRRWAISVSSNISNKNPIIHAGKSCFLLMLLLLLLFFLCVCGFFLGGGHDGGLFLFLSCEGTG